MLALIQRVSEASVTIDGEVAGAIGPGLLVLLGIQKADDEAVAGRLLDKVLAYRVFADDEGKMNRSVSDCQAGLLVVSQFTLAADTGRGLRPSFSSAMPPAGAEALYEHFLDQARQRHAEVQSGRFAADMKVSLINDGPVTFMLQAT